MWPDQPGPVSGSGRTILVRCPEVVAGPSWSGVRKWPDHPGPVSGSGGTVLVRCPEVAGHDYNDQRRGERTTTHAKPPLATDGHGFTRMRNFFGSGFYPWPSVVEKACLPDLFDHRSRGFPRMRISLCSSDHRSPVTVPPSTLHLSRSHAQRSPLPVRYSPAPSAASRAGAGVAAASG